MRDHEPREPRPTPTLWSQFREALKRGHRRRPASFYLLLATPVVLYLAVDLLAHRDEPRRFAIGLILLMLFFGVVLVRAVMDLFDIGRRHLRDSSRTYRETLGDEEFMATLRDRREEHDDKE